jgi:protein CLEC16A
VDYYVNLLKSLSIKLTSETVNFFFNDKLKTFPLYYQAIMFFNHKDQLVRTSVQSIALTLFNIPNPEMQGLFTVLPFCQFFANVVCRLRSIWLQMDHNIE